MNIYTWIITTYCIKKRGFDWRCARCFFAPSSILLSLSPIYYPGSLLFFSFTFVPLQVLNHLPFAYLSLASLSSTPLHYEVQLRIDPGKFIYIFLDSVTFQKNYITISFLICLTHLCTTNINKIDHIACLLKYLDRYLWSIISHLKVYRIGFLGKKGLMENPQNLRKISIIRIN